VPNVLTTDNANLREALEATRIVDSETGGTLNSGAKSAALSIFEGTKQRFFAQLLLSMKLPSMLPAIDGALADGNAVVVFFAVAVYVERGGGRRRFPSVFHDFTPDNMRVRGNVRGRARPAFERR
jgi:hypothetical protein